MSKNRDVVAEIKSIRNRLRFTGSMELSERLSALKQAYIGRSTADKELMRYFPVALVACIEAYGRVAIKELVDAGEPYWGRAEKLLSGKLDFSILHAIQGKAVTAGELIAHGVSLSRLDHLDSNLTLLLGKSFLTSLRSVTDRWLEHILGTEALMIPNPDQVFAHVIRTFEFRHIICHETAAGYEIPTNEIEECFESCILFLEATVELISQTLYPNAPLTQADMNEEAGGKLEAKRAELEETLMNVRGRAYDIAALEESQVRWEAYAEAWAHFVVGPRDGSIWPMVHAEAVESVLVKRIELLQAWRRLDEPL
jgi:hypothetical protein